MDKGKSEQLTYCHLEQRGLSSKGNELEKELQRAHKDVVIISETKKKLKGLKDSTTCFITVEWPKKRERLRA
jgi:hypothetical protein